LFLFVRSFSSPLLPSLSHPPPFSSSSVASNLSIDCNREIASTSLFWIEMTEAQQYVVWLIFSLIDSHPSCIENKLIFVFSKKNKKCWHGSLNNNTSFSLIKRPCDLCSIPNSF
jgi:hypothetical protein